MTDRKIAIEWAYTHLKASGFRILRTLATKELNPNGEWRTAHEIAALIQALRGDAARELRNKTVQELGDDAVESYGVPFIKEQLNELAAHELVAKQGEKNIVYSATRHGGRIVTAVMDSTDERLMRHQVWISDEKVRKDRIDVKPLLAMEDVVMPEGPRRWETMQSRTL